MDLGIGSNRDIRSNLCSWVDIGCGMDEDLTNDLVRRHVIWEQEEFWGSLGIVLEVDALGNELVLMALDDLHEVLQGVDLVHKCLLLVAHRHQQVLDGQLLIHLFHILKGEVGLVLVGEGGHGP
eukprot:CAMPEP_0170545772 /NCGR_PEP_ID=MMETSP0211-20121228/4145_1 /TAXON_ID=311385 /ORGANISM="Pseudokeronopsis sp., Strain OXSARD2" /LENGTH=123 /DNA_ID=CAMNT_0010849869 /DNA_START=273 /DNA_END=644 /DNA_ORIENTATION=-